jgi:flagellar biosynthesis regulator FlaF
MVEVTQVLIDRLRSGASMLKQAGFAFDREHRAMTDAADALTTAQAEAEALRAEVERLREALERLLTMPGDVDLSCNPHQAQVDALNARRKVWNFARAALSEPMP